MRLRRPVPVLFAVFAALLLATTARAQLSIRIDRVSGPVDVLRAAQGEGVRPDPLPFSLDDGDTVKTGAEGFAEVTFSGETRVLVRPNTSFTVGRQGDSKVTVNLLAGRVKAWVQGAMRRKFAVRTPTAVASVRGTEFDVEHGEESLVEVYDGLISVRDLLGNEMLVASGERLRIAPGRPLERPERIEGRILQEPKAEIRREVSLGLSKDEVQAAAALEARLAEYQEGKSLIDVNGQRVRLEEYIVRPAADQFKLVVLNERESRLDYFYYRGTFNQTLPTDLRVALKDLGGKTDADAPAFWLIDAESGRSNTQDSIVETWSGGHVVQTTLASDKTVFHPDSDSFETVPSGTALWENIFDNYSYKVKGVEWFGWEPLSAANITGYDYSQWRTRIAGKKLGTSGADIACASESDCTTKESQLRSATITKPDGSSSLHDRVVTEYRDSIGGSVLYTETYDFYVADDAGRIALTSDFTGVTSGQSYLETLLRFNYETVIETSVFSGRKIDLVIEPKILIRSGLLE